jgi:hypothetical protein
MPKVKVPDRVQELAAELELDLGDDTEFTTDPEGLIGWMQSQNSDQKNEEMERRDHIDSELEALLDKMMENVDDA